MIFIIIFSFLSLSNAVSIQGNWKDSSLKDEALVFFEKVEPSLLKKVKSLLKSVDEDNQSQILDSVSNFVEQPLFGLLNLSLSLRYFNPIASIKSPKEGNPSLRGWYLLEKTGENENTKELQNIQFALIKSADYIRTPLEKLDYFKRSSFSIKSLVSQNRKSQLAMSARQTIKKYPQDYYYSGINGRVVKPHYFDILDGLIEEYRYSKLFSFSKSLLYKKGYRKPYYFTKQLMKAQNLPPFNFEKISDKWSDDPNLKSSDYMQILRCKKPIATVNIYFDLHSPESPALLNWAIEHVLKSDPIHFNFTLFFDINNQTEKHIGYAWHQSVDTLGVRNAVLFMIDGFKKNNFKRAYKATIPTLSWKKIKNNMVSGNRHTTRIRDQLNYCKEKNITVAAAINGEFVQERPIFPIIENKLFTYVNRIKKAVQEDDKINFSRIIEWTEENSIELSKSTFPIEITFNNYITINGFSNEVINSTAYKIVSLSNDDSFKYPIIFLNSASKSDIELSQFSEEEIQLLKINKKDVFTIFGPLVFKGTILNNDQLEFAEKYINYVFLTNNLENDLSKENMLLSLFYRSTNALDGVERESIRDDLPNSLKIELNTKSNLKWEIIDDPLSSTGSVVLDMASHVYDSGAASIVYYPNVKHNEYSNVPPHFYYRFHSSFTQDTVEVDNNSYLIKTSPYWSIQKEKNKDRFTCISVVTSSLLTSKGKRVKISDYLITSTNDIGYFSPDLPIGLYEMKGMSSRSTLESEGSYFYIDNFVPHTRFYFDNGEIISPSPLSNKLNIVITSESDPEQFNTDVKILIYTILNKTKKNKDEIKFFIASENPSFEMIDNLQIKNLPLYLPHFYSMIQANNNHFLVRNWKFILSDIYLSNDDVYLFVDSKILFLGDASRFLRLDMSNDAVIAAPIMTDRWFNNDKLPWNSRKFLMMRFKRPYHTTSIIWNNIERWSSLHVGDRFRMLLKLYLDVNEKDEKIGELIFNSIQLYAQFITLPEEVAFNSERSPQRLAKKALAIDLNAAEGIRLAGIKYEKIKQQALNQFA